MKRTVPPTQRCVFCTERWEVAVGGQRICRKHLAIIEDIARDAGVPVHITVHQLTREPSRGPQKIGEIMPGVVAEILANQKLPPRSTAVPTPSARER